jgi:ribosomal protein L27
MEHEICLKAIAIAPHLLVKALGGDPVERGKIIVEQPGRYRYPRQAP